MSRRLVGLAAAAALCGCNPEPRSVSYFQAHPDETDKVLVDCAAGSHRGAECDNARAAKARIDADARMALYKKTFSGQ